MQAIADYARYYNTDLTHQPKCGPGDRVKDRLRIARRVPDHAQNLCRRFLPRAPFAQRFALRLVLSLRALEHRIARSALRLFSGKRSLQLLDLSLELGFRGCTHRSDPPGAHAKD